MAIKDHIGIDTSGYAPIQTPPPSNSQLEQPLLPVRDSKLRFSAPNIPGSFPSSDTLVGYHMGGMIPQWRIPTAPSQSSGGSGTTITNAAIVSSTNTNTTSVSKFGVISSATFHVPVLSPGGIYTGSLGLLGEGWIFFGFTCSFPMRVRAYGTQTSQTTDLTRPITQGPGFGTSEDIIFDVNLTTLPTIWDFTPTVMGVNNNPGTSQLIYLTITNNSAASSSGLVTLTYAPIASVKAL